MRAMLLEKLGVLERESQPLRLAELPDPLPEDDELLLAVRACGVCHTELDEIEGRAAPKTLPFVLGHQVVGEVIACGENVKHFPTSEPVGVGWVGGTCACCEYCLSERENLCAKFCATGRDRFGGYGELMTVKAVHALPLPRGLDLIQAAPLLCAGAIGYRSLRLARLEKGERLGLTGFGASAHIVLQLVKVLNPSSEVFVFARSALEREFAASLGAVWTGDTNAEPPERLHAIIDTTPAWNPMIKALEALVPGGRLIVNAIRKEERDKDVLREISYEKHLWLEKQITSVANVSTDDIRQVLEIAATAKIRSTVREYDLSDANRALTELKFSPAAGAKVLRIRG